MHILSVDLESFVHVSDYVTINPILLSTSDQRKDLDGGYIVAATRDILQLLKSHSATATFFIVSEIAEWYPDLIAEIIKEGHEIGMHSATHRNVNTLDAMESELNLAEKFIKQYRPSGFRAPNMMITPQGIELLYSKAFKYDSSSYGDNLSRVGNMLEIPVSIWRYRAGKTDWPRSLNIQLLSQGIPVGSGLALGALGSILSLFLRKPGKLVTIHPWQVTPPPWHKIGAYKRLVKKPVILPYLVNRKAAFRKLLTRHGFTSIANYYNLG